MFEVRVCVCAFCVFLRWFHCVRFSGFAWFFLRTKLYVRKYIVCDMLMVFPKTSIPMEQIHIFRTNAIAELILWFYDLCHGSQETSQVKLDLDTFYNPPKWQKLLKHPPNTIPTHLPPNKGKRRKAVFLGDLIIKCHHWYWQWLIFNASAL